MTDKKGCGLGVDALKEMLEGKIDALKELHDNRFDAVDERSKANAEIVQTNIRTVREALVLQAEKYETKLLELNHENARVQENANKGTPREMWQKSLDTQQDFNSRVEKFMAANPDPGAFRSRVENYMSANANLGDFRTRTDSTLSERKGHGEAVKTYNTLIIAAAGALGGLIVWLVPLLLKR